MAVTRHPDIDSFCARALPTLLEREAENNLAIGIALRLRENGGANQWGEDEPLLMTIEEQGQVLGAAVQTPPHNLIVTRLAAPAAAGLAEGLHALGLDFPGVLGPRETAANFVAAWRRLSGAQADAIPKALRIYQVERVTPPQHVSGRAEWATEADVPVVSEWAGAFATETQIDAPDPMSAAARRAVAEGRLLLWTDPEPVSMAGCAGPTPSGIRISFVYTPPERRRRGFASGVVAALSQRLLDGGRRFCYLFTDLSNAIANSVYQKIGYQMVCDIDLYRFRR